MGRKFKWSGEEDLDTYLEERRRRAMNEMHFLGRSSRSSSSSSSSSKGSLESLLGGSRSSSSGDSKGSGFKGRHSIWRLFLFDYKRADDKGDDTQAVFDRYVRRLMNLGWKKDPAEEALRKRLEDAVREEEYPYGDEDEGEAFLDREGED